MNFNPSLNFRITYAFISLLVAIGFAVVASPTRAEYLDSIVAVVEDDVILESELSKESSAIMQRIQASDTQAPPEVVIRKQVLEKMIVEKLQRQQAERMGIKINDETVNNSAVEVAQRNHMSLAQFRAELERQGMTYKSFFDTVRDEIAINQLKAREIGSRIQVTEHEIDHFLETQDKIGDEAVQYHLGHILIAVKEAASPAEVQLAQNKAAELVKRLRAGEDFSQLAIGNSNDNNALKGGDLGWRTIGDVPSLFQDTVTKMQTGEIADPIRSPSGFHIIKMLALKGLEGHIITKTKVSHILIKTNELINDAEARNKLLALKARIHDGEDFAALARAYSDDKGSALKDGSLDWVNPGDLVKPFEQAMNESSIGEISEPVQTQFGWHLIKVTGRENKDNSAEYRRNLIRETIRKRKIEEETGLWLRRLRDEAFVEINQSRL